MKQFKKVVLVMLAGCLLLTLSACQKGGEFESVRSFELNFFKEEYEEEYSKMEKTIALDDKANYQIQIDGVCTSGTITVKLSYVNADGEPETVDFSAPCSSTIVLDKGTAKSVDFAISINPETEGKVVVDILSDNA